MQRFDGFGGKSAAFETGLVFTVDLDLALGGGSGKRQDILGDHAIAADHRMPADAAELMDRAAGADYRPIVDGDVAAHGRGVR